MAPPLDMVRRGNVDMFVTLTTDTGKIQGEAADSNYAGAIEITGWSWGMSAHSNIATGQATARRQHKPLRLYKNIDCATTSLGVALARNQLVKELKLVCRKAGTGAALEYLVIVVRKGRVANLELEYMDQSMGGTGREMVEITYQEITIDYTPQTKVGLSNATKTFEDKLTDST
jgi:type VI secretion system secreted protein Hcp